jgi:tetratricopeptide (TPR) repeat protein
MPALSACRFLIRSSFAVSAAVCAAGSAFAAIQQTPPAPPQAAAAPAQLPATDPLTLFPAAPAPNDSRTRALLSLGVSPDTLIGEPNGPGVIVCPPATDASLHDFAVGCGAWLQISAGGNPDCDRTPLLASLGRIPGEMGASDLALDADQARRLPGMFGITRFAVGSLSGEGDRLTLTYQVYGIGYRSPVAKDISVTGTKDAIAAALPEIARKIAIASESSGNGIAATSLSADSLTLAGHLMNGAVASAAERQTLASLDTGDPLAAVCYWRYGHPNQTQLNRSVERILNAPSANALVLGEAVQADRKYVASHSKTIDALAAAHPKNYLLAVLEAGIARERHDRVAERSAAEAAVRASSKNPEAWQALDSAIATADADLWHGRAKADLTAEELAASARNGKQRYFCAKKAMEIDPKYGLACLGLSMAAEDQGQHAVAQSAFWNAVSLDPEKCNVFRWGLSLYGTHHISDGGQTLVIARLAARMDVAAATTQISDTDPRVFVATLRGAGYRAEAAQLKTAFQTELAAELKSRPDDPTPRFALAGWYEQEGNWKKALALYREAERIVPASGAAYRSAGEMLDQLGQPDAAIAEFNKALDVDPNDQAAACDLAWDLKHAGKLEEAERLLKMAISVDPYFAPSHYDLASTYSDEKKMTEAIAEYERTLVLDPGFDAYGELCGALMSAGRYEEALRVGRQALNTDPLNSDVLDDMAEIYLQKDSPAQSSLLSQYAIQVDNSDSRAHEDLAESCLKLGKIAQAQSEWKTVVKLGDTKLVKQAQDFLAKYNAPAPTQ